MSDTPTAYTDYPLYMPEKGKMAPIRRVTPLSYDGDKYVTVMFNGERFCIKAGYLYSEPGRVGEVDQYDTSLIPSYINILRGDGKSTRTTNPHEPSNRRRR